ncbi:MULTISPECIES: hypothetical protein [unclassified Microcystis]|uniref:hypothetical protein n=1 Tax=unclassified Microcystis TaxID=2643300 RepID=UPI0022C610FE|nr:MULTISPECIES: hypothetical protein [unclassified Microcystis]MCA2504077.1 hypothetical protein [Microcystis sp. M62BS1]MCA2552099.1 hypothetical protein [Microcystis sp. M53BS1]MCA2555427.1 hypothetical protein [Microcystis sp. M43BS1]MCA2572002.1 hypothetical protein [Microcystis sp. M42BS1]MCA2604163.1 hypothetical protein [Microcystis sp. M26BS1]MCA2611526.1 hypothetical protein [Microcystis sp. M27BS1]MCA2616344.1 hypothetical protein [Microcystis sp. M25BS1]
MGLGAGRQESGDRRWGNGEVGKWVSGEVGKWGSGEVGKWGISTKNPNTLKP